jgi:hypothetical protein
MLNRLTRKQLDTLASESGLDASWALEKPDLVSALIANQKTSDAIEQLDLQALHDQLLKQPANQQLNSIRQSIKSLIYG